MHLVQGALGKIQVVMRRGLDGVGVESDFGNGLIDPVAGGEDGFGQIFLLFDCAAGQLHQMVHSGGVGGDADALFPGVDDESADLGKEAIEVGRYAPGSTAVAAADGAGKIRVAVSNGRDVAVDLVEGSVAAK